MFTWSGWATATVSMSSGKHPISEAETVADMFVGMVSSMLCLSRLVVTVVLCAQLNGWTCKPTFLLCGNPLDFCQFVVLDATEAEAVYDLNQNHVPCRNTVVAVIASLHHAIVADLYLSCLVFFQLDVCIFLPNKFSNQSSLQVTPGTCVSEPKRLEMAWRAHHI